MVNLLKAGLLLLLATAVGLFWVWVAGQVVELLWGRLLVGVLIGSGWGLYLGRLLREVIG